MSDPVQVEVTLPLASAIATLTVAAPPVPAYLPDPESPEVLLQTAHLEVSSPPGSPPALVVLPAGGPPGTNGREVEIRNNGTHLQWRYAGAGDESWTNIVALADLTGADSTVPGPAGNPGSGLPWFVKTETEFAALPVKDPGTIYDVLIEGLP